jgi:hypothetical protein
MTHYPTWHNLHDMPPHTWHAHMACNWLAYLQIPTLCIVFDKSVPAEPGGMLWAYYRLLILGMSHGGPPILRVRINTCATMHAIVRAMPCARMRAHARACAMHVFHRSLESHEIQTLNFNECWKTNIILHPHGNPALKSIHCRTYARACARMRAHARAHARMQCSLESNEIQTLNFNGGWTTKIILICIPMGILQSAHDCARMRAARMRAILPHKVLHCVEF